MTTPEEAFKAFIATLPPSRYSTVIEHDKKGCWVTYRVFDEFDRDSNSTYEGMIVVSFHEQCHPDRDGQVLVLGY